MKKYLLFIAVLVSGFSYGQERCSTTRKIEEKMAANPEFARRYLNSLEETPEQAPALRTTLSPTTVVTIPVVVHVLYKNATQNISLAQINSQIAILNQDYRKLNTDFATVVPAPFQTLAADFELNFVLAVRTPDDEPTTGIERKQVPGSFVFEDSYYQSAGLPAWDPLNYLNIWVGAFSDDGILGFAYPSAAAGMEDDGLCIGYKYFGNTGTAVYPYNKGRTATHEIGHYFNLAHIWGNTNNDTSGCTNTGINSDGVADTPKTNEAYYDCETFPNNDHMCTATANGAMFMNYMDYVPDACMAFFTAGQKTRAINALNNDRSELLTSLGATPLSIEELEAKNVSISPNPASSYFAVTSKVTVDSVEIINSLGQKVKEVTLDGANVVGVEDLASGVYFIRFYGEGKFLKTKRLIKK